MTSRTAFGFVKSMSERVLRALLSSPAAIYFYMSAFAGNSCLVACNYPTFTRQICFAYGAIISRESNPHSSSLPTSVSPQAQPPSQQADQRILINGRHIIKVVTPRDIGHASGWGRFIPLGSIHKNGFAWK